MLPLFIGVHNMGNYTRSPIRHQYLHCHQNLLILHDFRTHGNHRNHPSLLLVLDIPVHWNHRNHHSLLLVPISRSIWITG